MRQVGVLAAAGLYALENNVDRLVEDHQKAQVLAKAISDADGLTLHDERVDTNIINFDVSEDLGTAEQFCQRLLEQGVRMLPTKRHFVRAVTHLDVSMDDIQQVAKLICKV